MGRTIRVNEATPRSGGFGGGGGGGPGGGYGGGGGGYGGGGCADVVLHLLNIATDPLMPA